ncbi:MAG: SDR family oxidoreductase [Alphaproteobacteria bacterium]|nr:SDR family oxidoreductase [Alphaproteobacteria bacterium]
MRVFITGATGFIGMALTADLIAAGHEVVGLCRNPDKAAALAAAGARVLEGSLEDEAGLRAGVEAADGVVHLAFNHDFSTYMANCADDRRVIGVLGEALAGKPLLVTSGTSMAAVGDGEPAREDSPPASSAMVPRAASEEAAFALVAAGANVGVVRLPQVHDRQRQGLVSPCIAIFREKGMCAYVGDGASRWPAAHVSDVARLYRLALERAEPGAVYHASAEDGVSQKAIAETLAARLGLPVRSIPPEEAGDLFGVFALFVGRDSPSSSEITRAKLAWTPTGPTLLEDLARLELA